MDNTRIIYKVSYDIPLANVSLPGRQNRASDGILRVTPGMTEAMEFWFHNHDGIPLNLTPFQIKLVIWKNVRSESDARVLDNAPGEIIFAKLLTELEQYSGKALIMLDSSETMEIGRLGGPQLHWSLFLINADRQVFPVQCNSAGSRHGLVHLDLGGGIPNSELILTA